MSLPLERLCCEISSAAGEPLFATAARVDVWLLLEYNAAWGAKALPESPLPETVKTFLNDQQAAVPNTRFQFIKRTNTGDSLHFYVAVSSASHPRLYHFHLNTYEDILTFNLRAVVANAPDYAQAITDERLYLVCTNGKRDAACARYGLPLYQHMSQLAGDSVWQTTHIGGHRFAGTCVCLPRGLTYGRVDTNLGQTIITDYMAERITLEHYRGASFYDGPVQAADYFLRQQIGMSEVNDVRLLGVENQAENHWRIQFESTTNVIYTVEVRAELSDFETLESTRDTQTKQVPQYRLVTCEVEPELK
jgi:hypothetical protein